VTALIEIAVVNGAIAIWATALWFICR